MPSEETLLLYAVYAAVFLGIVVLTRVLCKVSDIIVNNTSKRFSPSAIHWKFIRQVNKFIIIVAGLLFIVHYIPAFRSVSSTLMAGSTVVMAAIGLAAQGPVSNIISGVFISIFKPFAVGDRIRLTSSNITGIVSDINLRHTTIKTPHNNSVLIPNSIINNEILENSNHEDGVVCNFLDLKVCYDADIDMIRRVAAEYLTGHADYLKEKPVGVSVRDISDYGVDIRISVWTESVDKNFALCSDMREHLIKSGIKFKNNWCPEARNV